MSSEETLAAFLSARLDEDEAIAREAAGLTECWVAEEPAIGVVLVDGEPLIEGHIAGLTAHIARHDPARVLREVEAVRAVVAAYEKSVRVVGEGLSVSNRRLVLAFAAVYGAHPDFRPEWALPGRHR
ncbi:MAG TPA: DUF6221 family protein [Streptosporangiaceae bacterium]|nr:DUF6221 family protein [Streptosporangiaceae bacterium]